MNAQKRPIFTFIQMIYSYFYNFHQIILIPIVQNKILFLYLFTELKNVEKSLRNRIFP